VNVSVSNIAASKCCIGTCGIRKKFSVTLRESDLGRSWLGHAHLDTTNHYARASVQTKREALEKIPKSSRPGKPPRWKRDADLMAWLDAL
jgi:hypothetical protein